MCATFHFSSAVTFANDINSNIRSIGKCHKTDKNRSTVVYNKISEFVEFHSEVKQLSNFDLHKFLNRQTDRQTNNKKRSMLEFFICVHMFLDGFAASLMYFNIWALASIGGTVVLAQDVSIVQYYTFFPCLVYNDFYFR